MLKSNLCYSSGKALRMKDRSVHHSGYYLLACLLIGLNLIGKIELKLPSPVKEVQATSVIIKEVKTPDTRVLKLQDFLDEKRSPLAKYAQLIVEEADKNDIGYTWITGIACMESACGLKLPQNSYNAWGLGGNNFMYFNSWEESIKYMSALIGNDYRHDMLQGIKVRYCPASDNCNSNWASIVAGVSKEILQ